MVTKPVTVVALAGSLRKDSYNAALLRAAATAAGQQVNLTIAQLQDIPVFSEDLEVPEPPAAVQRLVESFRAADGILLATPEYNGSIPGGLKNAVDWLSRAEGTLAGKAAALMGATPGRGGTVGAQVALRDLLTRLGADVLALRVFVSEADRVFNAAGELIDASVEQQVKTQVRSLVEYIEESKVRAVA